MDFVDTNTKSPRYLTGLKDLSRRVAEPFLTPLRHSDTIKQRRNRMRVIVWMVALMLLASCGIADSAGSTQITPPTVAPTRQPEMPLPTNTRPAPIFTATSADPVLESAPTMIPQGNRMLPPYDAVVLQFVATATADLSQRLAVPANQIEVAEVQSVIWPNAGMGCPQPGMAYKQVPVDGILIVLRANGQPFSYHGGNGREPFYCANPQLETPGGGDLSQ
jgi:hypothetical protein